MKYWPKGFDRDFHLVAIFKKKPQHSEAESHSKNGNPFQWHNQVNKCDSQSQTVKWKLYKTCNFVVITAPPNGWALVSTRPSAGTAMTKFASRSKTSPALSGLTKTFWLRNLSEDSHVDTLAHTKDVRNPVSQFTWQWLSVSTLKYIPIAFRRNKYNQ